MTSAYPQYFNKYRAHPGAKRTSKAIIDTLGNVILIFSLALESEMSAGTIDIY
jgi:hypothetical protein